MGLFPKDRDLTRPPERVTLAVDASFFRERVDGFQMRLDQFLAAHLPWRSRSSIQDLVHDGYVLVDAATPDHPRGTGEPRTERRPGRRLRHGSTVVVVIPDENRLAGAAGAAGELRILYEDEAVVAVDKPPLLAVHPSGRHLTDTLIQRVHAHYRDEIAAGRLAPRLCHRLDRETSGIVLVGKRPGAHAELVRQFEEREVDKEYLAIVQPPVPGEQGRTGRIDYPLAPARTSAVRVKMTVAADGLAARTDWRIVERYADCSLLACRLHTGRQHQIRVHLAAIGHPVVGDKLYGPDELLFQKAADGRLERDDLERLELPRHALHSHKLAFDTPARGRRVALECPLAEDLRAYLAARVRLG